MPTDDDFYALEMAVAELRDRLTAVEGIVMGFCVAARPVGEEPVNYIARTRRVCGRPLPKISIGVASVRDGRGAIAAKRLLEEVYRLRGAK
jgi:hypothetical protein